MPGGKVNGSRIDLDAQMGTNYNLSDGKISRSTIKLLQEIEDLRLSLGMKTVDYLEKYQVKLEKAAEKEKKERLKKDAKELADYTRSTTGKIFKQIGDNLVKALGTGLTKAFSSIDSYIQSYTRYMGTITTRLQGTNLTYSKLSSDIARNLGTSPYLKQTEMIDNLNKFVEAGIAYNVESRAYIATATNKIATTFNAFDSSLLRIIRIQQADSTVARIGMESLLTKFLNAQYGDTSYLSSIGTGNITGQLLEAESLMGYQGASEFDYAVQKWLGSMTASGVSSNTVNLLAQGLGYLGSGNISALSGNTALQNLLVMATGGNYGKYLTGGLTASSASDILQNIVGFGKSIATSGNNVVRSELANLFGLSVSDLVSLTNLTAQDIKAITDNIVTYETLRNETTTQLETMGQRTTMSEHVANVMSNVLASLGANVANNPWLYGTWELASLMANSGLDYNFNVGFLGTGTSFSLSQLMKTGVVGGGLVGSISNAIQNIRAGNVLGTQLGVWGERETRGTGLATNGITSGLTTSSSSYLGTFDESNYQQTFQDQQKNAAEYTGQKEDDENSMEYIIKNSINQNIAGIYAILTSWNDNVNFPLRERW